MSTPPDPGPDPAPHAPEPLAVPATLAGERVDRAVALLTGWSRAEVQDLVERQQVLVDGRAVAKSRRLVEGEVVELLGEPAPVGLPQPEPIPLVADIARDLGRSQRLGAAPYAFADLADLGPERGEGLHG